jgi:hypothetical protein
MSAQVTSIPQLRHLDEERRAQSDAPDAHDQHEKQIKANSLRSKAAQKILNRKALRKEARHAKQERRASYFEHKQPSKVTCMPSDISSGSHATGGIV